MNRASRVSRPAAGLILASCLVLASWASAGALAVLVAVLAARTCLSLASPAAGDFTSVASVSAAAAGSFPIWILARGDQGLMWAACLSVLAVAAALLLSGRTTGAVKAAGTVVWLPLYIGLGLSYAVLIREGPWGRDLLLCAWALLFVYKGGSILISRSGPPGNFSSGKAWFVPFLKRRLIGLVGAVFAALVCGLFLNDRFGSGALALLGLAVGLAAMLGEAAGKMVEDSLSTSRPFNFPAWATLDAWLIALPAFFYGFRLFLT